jgi:PAS domain S-box-containing protein
VTALPSGDRRREPRLLPLLAVAVLVAALPSAGRAEAAAASREFLAAHPTWRVAGDPYWRPYTFRAADGQLVGLDVEFSRILAERIGVRIEWVDVPSWSEALRRFRAGEIDVLMSVARTPERDAEMLFTEPYASSPVAVIARLDAPFLVTLRDLDGQRVAAPEAHVTTDYLRKVPGDLRLQIHPGLDDAIRAVSEGRADAMVAGLVPSATAIRALGLDNLKVAGLVDMRFDLRVAVRRDWAPARALLDGAIAADPPEVRIERFDRWIGPILGLQRQALRWRGLFVTGLAVAGALALAVLGVGGWNRALRRRVERATATIRAEAAARTESELRFRTMFEQAPLGMYRSTPGGTFLSVNPFLARLFEFGSPDEMVREVNGAGIARTLFDDPELRPRIVAAALSSPGGLVVSQVRYRTRTGKPIEALLSMAAVDDPVSGERALLGFVQDVTARVRDEATRRQREKMLALGQLAGGVAHDFNNLLYVVLTEAELLAAERGGDPVVADAAHRILESVAGARALTDRLLRFVRARGAEAAGAYAAQDAVRGALGLFESAAAGRVRVVQELESGEARVDGIQADLQNAVLNLCLNARDAMPDGGTVTVRARGVALSPDDCAGFAPYALAPGGHVAIEVEDSGAGMTPEVLASCTDPFFTTKGEAGTGLGLWMVHCVVAGHRGAMRIRSRAGEGTTVTLLLPLASGERPPAPP